MTSFTHQRAGDLHNETHRRIDDLIEQTEDPALKATLLVLSRIDISLDSNTKATDRISKELESFVHNITEDVSSFRTAFDGHETREEKFYSSIRGAWWAGTVLIGALLAMGVFIGNGFKTQHESQEARINQLETAVLVLKMQAAEGGRR
jgi:hypothetical protein